MKILIVAPKYTPNVGDYYAFPLGIAYVSAALKSAGFNVSCLNLSHHEDAEQALADALTATKPDILCTGGLSTDFQRIRQILSLARQTCPDITIILGGGIITSDPYPVFDLLKIDYGVIGEGEITIVELVQALIEKTELSAVRGIIFRNPQNVVTKTEDRDPIDDLDSIPFPDYEGFEASRYLDYQMSNDMYDLSSFDAPRYLPIISSRSCPYSCTFCFHPLGKKYRQRSLDNFFRELDILIERYNINYAGIYDELFSNDQERIVTFCAEMKKRNIKWMTQLRVDKVNEELLATLRESGLFFVSYGIESANDNILKSMKKNITVSQIEYALKLTTDMHIGTQGNLIFGDREETWETAMQSLRWFHKHRHYNLGLIPIVVYPGTPLYWYALENNLIKDRIAFLENPEPINISRLSDTQYHKLMQLLWDTSLKTYAEFRGKLLRKDLIANDPVKGPIYHMETICPFCGNHNIFPRFNVRGIDRFVGLLIHCKNCYRQHAVYETTLFVRIMMCLPSILRRKIIDSRETLSRIKNRLRRLAGGRS